MSSLTRRLFTVEEYEQMGHAGILHEDDRVELIEGEVVRMSPIGKRHNACVDRANRFFVRAVGENAIVRVQGSVRLSLHSEPQPDLVLLRPRPDFYAEERASPRHVLLILEVSVTTQDYDRRTKGRLYACAGIPEFWLIDLGENRVEVYRKPSPEGYQQATRLDRHESISLLALPELNVHAGELLG